MSPQRDPWPADARASEAMMASTVSHLHARNRTLEKRERDLEKQAARAQAQVQVYEAPIYGPGSGHSWFADVARSIRQYSEARDGGLKAAEDRLHKHSLYQHRENERRLAGLRAEAEYATYRAASQTRQEAALLQRWLDDGGQAFEMKHQLRDIERRGDSRTAGAGGYFTIPGFLIDQWVHAPRAGAPFAALWQRAPLPPKVTSVNLPAYRTGGGAGTGVQPGDLAPVTTRDPSEGLVSAPTRTLAATLDIALEWLDQLPSTIDETLGADLAEDFQTQLDGQLLLGSGTGQLNGIIPGGTFSASNMCWLQDTNNTAAQSWSNGGSMDISGSLHQMTSQLRRKISRARALAATHYVMPESVWDIICGSGITTTDLPLVLPGVHHPDSVPMLHGLPIVFDDNILETFGGTNPPVITTSAGRFSPTDGNGTWAPILAGRWSDCIYWQSDPIVDVMPEVLSGTLKVRLQVRSYVASIPGRVLWGGTNQTYSGTNQGGGLNNGAPCSYGAVTNFVSNSILQPAANGY